MRCAQLIPYFMTTALVASITFGQSHSNVPPAGEQLDIRVINVDAYVTADGKPNLALTPADFEILEDGVPQKITNFAIVDDASVRSAPDAQPEAVDAQFARRIALVFDNNYIEKRDRDQAMQRFEEFANESLKGSDCEWSVGIISSRFELLQPFTSDLAAVRAALQRVRKTPVMTANNEISRDILSDSLRRTEADRGEDYGSAVEFAGRAQTYRNARSALSTVLGIVEATRLYGQSSGKKVMFLVTGGMQLNTTFTSYDKGSADREVSDTKQQVQKLLEEVVQEANAANVSIDVITARTRGSMAAQYDVENSSAGFKRPTIRQAPSAPNDPRAGSGAHVGGMSQTVMNDPIDTGDVDSSGFRIANATGGLYLTSNVVRDSFAQAQTSASHYYSLGYRPSHSEDGKYHDITVRVKAPGNRVTHRNGYRDITPEQQLQELLRMRVSVLQPAAAVPVDVELAPVTRESGKPVVAFTAAMPMKEITFVSSEGNFAGRVHVYVSLFDKAGRNVGFHHFLQNVVVPANLHDRALADKFRYKSSLALEKGEYTLAVTLRDDLSRDIGTGIQKLKL